VLMGACAPAERIFLALIVKVRDRLHRRGPRSMAGRPLLGVVGVFIGDLIVSPAIHSGHNLALSGLVVRHGKVVYGTKHEHASRS
jgi:hypothetical protein